jgi:hypothetical protein
VFLPKGDETQEEMFLKFPLKAGATSFYPRGGQRALVKVVGMEDVQVGGKTYPKCWHIHESTSDFTEESWYAEGVGLVKSIFTILRAGSFSQIDKELKEISAGEK